MNSIRLFLSHFGLFPPRNHQDFLILSNMFMPSDERKEEHEDESETKNPLVDFNSANASAYELHWKNILRQVKNLDTISSREQIKVAVLYASKGQYTQNSILKNQRGSELYEQFVDSLGFNIDLKTHKGFDGKLDSLRFSNGQFFPYYSDAFVEVFFHIATRMPLQNDEQQINKKRHIGNDHIHIIFSDHDRDYLPLTVTCDFSDIIIVISPRKGDSLFEIRVHTKKTIGYIHPIYDGMIVPHYLLGKIILQTCINCNKIIRMTSHGGGGGGGGGSHASGSQGSSGEDSGQTSILYYERPYPTRRKYINDLVSNYAVPFSNEKLLKLLYRFDDGLAGSNAKNDKNKNKSKSVRQEEEEDRLERERKQNRRLQARRAEFLQREDDFHFTISSNLSL